MLELRARLQSAATTGNGTAYDLGGRGTYHTFYIEGSDGVTAGAVTLETARSADYAGTWETLTTAITVGDDDVQIYVHTGPLLAVRARVSTAVEGGTVTVELVSVDANG